MMRTIRPLLKSLFHSLLLSSALVRAVSLDFPQTIRAGSNVSIDWKGQQPFDFAIFSVDPSTQVNTLLTQLIATQETVFNWPAVNAGTTVFFFVSDVTSQFAQSPNIVIQPTSGSLSSTTGSTSSSSSSTTHTASSSTINRTSSTSAVQTQSPSSPSSATSTPAGTTSSTSNQVTPTDTAVQTTSPSSSPSIFPSPTVTSSPSPATQQSLSKDRSLPYIIGIVAGLLGLILILIIVRYLVKWRRRRIQNSAALDNSPWKPGKSPGMSSFGFHGDFKDGSAFSAFNDVEKDGNGSTSMLPLHAMPYGRSYESSGSSPMLPPPSSQSRSTNLGRIANARASSVMLPMDDAATVNQSNEWGEEDEGDYRDVIAAMARTPSMSHAHQRNQAQLAERSLAEQQETPLPSSSVLRTQPQPPSSWKIIVPPVVPEFGHKLPVLESETPISSSSSKTTLATQYNPTQASTSALPPPQSLPVPAVAPSPTTSYSRERRPSSPSPFDDVVFDFGALSRANTTKTSKAGTNPSEAEVKAKRARDAARNSGERAIWPINVDDQEDDVPLKHPSLNFLLASPPVVLSSSVSAPSNPTRVSRIPSPTMPFGDNTPTASEMMTAMSIGSESEGAFAKRMLAGIAESSSSRSSSPSSTEQMLPRSSTPVLSPPAPSHPPLHPRAPSVLSQHSISGSSTMHSQLSHSPPRRRPQGNNWV